MELTNEKCIPCRAGGKPLPEEEARALARAVPGWTLAHDRIERELKFKDFLQAMAFVNQVADAAQAENHHPDIAISYNQVHLTLSTHKVGGLSRNDFILAAKIDRFADAAQALAA